MKARNLHLISLTILLICFFVNHSNAQYDASNLNTTVINSHSISSDFDFVYGMTFNDDGSKVYVVGYSNAVGFGSDTNKIGEYNLSTAYDISSVASNTILDITSHTSTAGAFGIIPTGISFNNDGSKMFAIGRSNGGANDFALLFEYSLSGGGTAYDLSDYDTGSISGLFLQDSGATFLMNPESIVFNPSGSSFYTIIADNQTIYEYTVSTNFDITSTVTQTQSFSVNTQESDPKGMTFNGDGTALFVIGEASDLVHQYALSTAYSVNGANFTQSSASISANDTSNNDVIFNNDGTKLFTVGDGNDTIYEYEITVVSTPTPAPVTPRLLYNGPTSYDVSTLTDSPSSNIAVSTDISDSSGFVFNSDGTRMYIVGTLTSGGTSPFDPLVSTPKILEYTLSTAYNISSATLNSTLDISSHTAEDSDYATGPFSITEPKDIAFNEDGTKMFVIGLTSLGSFGGILEYPSTGTAFNLSDYDTSNIEGNLNINFLGSGIRNPQSIEFNSDGTKMYISDSDDDNVTELNLGTAYDITSLTTLSFNFSVSAEEANITDAVFNFNGSKLLVVGTSGDDINQYDVSTNYSLSSASYTQTSVQLTTDSSPQGIAFKEDGTQLILLGGANDRLYNYDIPLGNYEEASENDGSINNTKPLQIQLLGATLKSTLTIGSDVTITYDGGAIPSGLTAVFSVSNNVATLTFTGNASPHGSANSITNISFVFADSAFTDAVAADIANSGSGGSYSAGIGIIFADCSPDITYNGSWSGGSTFGQPDDSDIGKGMFIQSSVTITGNASCNCLVIESGQTLNIANGAILTVANAINFEGNLVLLGNSQLKQNDTGTDTNIGSGSFTKQVATSLSNEYQYAYWTSPVSTPATSTYTINSVLTGPSFSNSYLYSYNANNVGSEHTWTSINESSTLNVGEGFTLKPGGDASKTYTYSGSPNNGDYTHTLGVEKYSLLGNPYPSALDADQFISDNSAVIDGTLYFYEAGTGTNHSPGDGGGYASYNLTGGVVTANTSSEVGVLTPLKYIPPGQGFFVGSVGGGNVTFTNSQRAAKIRDAGESVFFGRNSNSSKTNNKFLRIGLDANNAGTDFHRQVLVGFNGNTDAYENGYDGAMFDKRNTDMALSVTDKENPFVIIGTEYFNNAIEIPLTVYIEETQTVTFSIDDTDLTETSIYLKDTLTGEFYDIATNSKEIPLDAGTYSDRFLITFTNVVLSTEDNLLAKDFSIFYNNNELITSSKLHTIEKITMYNLLGQQIINYKNTDKASEIRINTKPLEQGIYIVKVSSKKGNITKKISVY